MCRCGTTLSSFPTGVLTKNQYSTEPIIGRKIAQATLPQAIYRLGTPTAQRKRQAFHEFWCVFSLHFLPSFLFDSELTPLKYIQPFQRALSTCDWARLSIMRGRHRNMVRLSASRTDSDLISSVSRRTERMNEARGHPRF